MTALDADPRLSEPDAADKPDNSLTKAEIVFNGEEIMWVAPHRRVPEDGVHLARAVVVVRLRPRKAIPLEAVVVAAAGVGRETHRPVEARRYALQRSRDHHIIAHLNRIIHLPHFPAILGAGGESSASTQVE